MVQLGNTPHSWREEIATMWRFTRNNGITEGFHTKMEVLQALDQKRGQTLDPKMVKHSWENTF
jgi:hypothetical protein